MDSKQFMRRVVDPGLALLTAKFPAISKGDEARVLMCTIAGQESAWTHRRQVGGPARSYWQFERNGGVAEVMQKTPIQLRAICDDQQVPYAIDTVFEAMAWNDPLAVCMARLLLWQDPAALPALGQKQAAWEYYLRNWRPGAPHPDAWPGLYDQSFAALAP